MGSVWPPDKPKGGEKYGASIASLAPSVTKQHLAVVAFGVVSFLCGMVAREVISALGIVVPGTFLATAVVDVATATVVALISVIIFMVTMVVSIVIVVAPVILASVILACLIGKLANMVPG